MKTRHSMFNKVLLGTAVIALSACQETVTKEEFNNAISDVTIIESMKKDSLERVYIETLDEIDRNLDEVRDHYGLLVINPSYRAEIAEPKKDQIINNITLINGLLDENRAKIEHLEKSLALYKTGKKELINSIQLAKENNLKQEQLIADFKELLAQKDYKIEELNNSVKTKDDEIRQLAASNAYKETTLNKRYFAYGTYEQLKQKAIVKKEGGLLGIKKVKVLNENLNQSEFAEIDKTKITSIPMVGKKPQLISAHPANTYTIETNGEDLATLTITDPENFWKVSKYLVVEIN